LILADAVPGCGADFETGVLRQPEDVTAPRATRSAASRRAIDAAPEIRHENRSGAPATIAP
jgi:hypothetical protein